MSEIAIVVICIMSLFVVGGVASQATVEFLQAKKFDELSKKD